MLSFISVTTQKVKSQTYYVKDHKREMFVWFQCLPFRIGENSKRNLTFGLEIRLYNIAKLFFSN